MGRDLFDQRLTDPTAAEVAAALRAAEAAANAGHTSGNFTHCYPDPIAERVLNERECMNGHFGSARGPANIARLSLGCWTNPAGRKLVRVRSWREWSLRYAQYGQQTESFNQSERDRHGRPGVWHVDWERVLEVATGGEPEWVAVCGCGAAGSAESLGWQHGMCGPCADRIAEFGPTAVAHAPGLLTDVNFEPQDVVFTQDGRFVVAVGKTAYRIWEAATGALALGNNATELMPGVRPAASTIGRFVVFALNNDFPLPINLTGRPAETQWKRQPTESRFKFNDIRAVHPTGRPDEFLVQVLNGPNLRLLNAAGGPRPPAADPPDLRAKLHAVWPDANAPRTAFADGHRASVARIEPDGTFTLEARFSLGDGRLNRTGMWQAGPRIVLFTPDGERLLFIRDTEMELRHPAKPKALLQATFPQSIKDAAFSPDYEHLFVLGADGAVYVCNPGTLTSVRARLRWHLGPASALAVSPDGQTLATAGSDGVKLWPVGRLLPLLV